MWVPGFQNCQDLGGTTPIGTLEHRKESSVQRPHPGPQARDIHALCGTCVLGSPLSTGLEDRPCPNPAQ